ncbi:MAG: OmpH family outer membrane protein [Idiomarina sp.]|nr:OmpH family outer membrane protein [Idiomarina sp.]
MKSAMLSLAFALFMSVLAMPAQASLKIAVVDVGAVFQQLPQREQISRTIEMEFRDRVERLQRMEEEMTATQERLQRDEAIMSEQQLQEESMNLQQMFQEYQQRREALGEQLNRRRNEERNRVLGQIQQVVADIAEAENYDVVLEAGNLAYAKNALDITARVLDRMTRD